MSEFSATPSPLSVALSPSKKPVWNLSIPQVQSAPPVAGSLMDIFETLHNVTSCYEASPVVMMEENVYEGDKIGEVNTRPTTGKRKGSKGMKLPWLCIKARTTNQRILRTLYIWGRWHVSRPSSHNRKKGTRYSIECIIQDYLNDVESQLAKVVPGWSIWMQPERLPISKQQQKLPKAPKRLTKLPGSIIKVVVNPIISSLAPLLFVRSVITRRVLVLLVESCLSRGWTGKLLKN